VWRTNLAMMAARTFSDSDTVLLCSVVAAGPLLGAALIRCKSVAFGICHLVGAVPSMILIYWGWELYGGVHGRPLWHHGHG